MRVIACGHRPRGASHHPWPRPTSAKNPRKMMEARDSRDRNAFAGCGTSRRSHAAIWNRNGRGIESARWRLESISRDFDTAREAVTRRKLPTGVRSSPSRTLCRRIRLRVTETAEPGKTRLNAEYGISPAREECARSDGAPKWPRPNLNLPLAAGPHVRHIRAHGAVAEWLKAAVC
jgi:hypothetical protein